MTGPELLDAVEARISNLRRELRMLSDWRNGCRSHNEDMGITEPREFLDVEEWDLVEGNAKRALETDDEAAEEGSIAQLRALLRTDEETAALRVGLQYITRDASGKENMLAYADMVMALNAISAARRAEIMGGEK